MTHFSSAPGQGAALPPVRGLFSEPGLPPARCVKSTDALVGYGFRCWMMGCRNRTFDALQSCWRCYAHFLAPEETRQAMTELACWVRVLETESARAIRINPLEADSFSADERMAVSVIAACQHQACPALRACTEALIGAGDVDATIKAARGFAYFLDDAGLTLSPSAMS